MFCGIKSEMFSGGPCTRTLHVHSWEPVLMRVLLLFLPLLSGHQHVVWPCFEKADDRQEFEEEEEEEEFEEEEE